MIDIEQYRAKIGKYLPRGKRTTKIDKSKSQMLAEFLYSRKFESSPSPGKCMFYFIIMYLAALTAGIMCDISHVVTSQHINFTSTHDHVYQLEWMTHVKYFYAVLIGFILKVRCKTYKIDMCYIPKYTGIFSTQASSLHTCIGLFST